MSQSTGTNHVLQAMNQLSETLLAQRVVQEKNALRAQENAIAFGTAKHRATIANKKFEMDELEHARKMEVSKQQHELVLLNMEKTNKEITLAGRKLEHAEDVHKHKAGQRELESLLTETGIKKNRADIELALGRLGNETDENRRAGTKMGMEQQANDSATIGALVDDLMPLWERGDILGANNIIRANLPFLNKAQRAGAVVLLNFKGAPTAKGAMDKALVAAYTEAGDGPVVSLALISQVSRAMSSLSGGGGTQVNVGDPRRQKALEAAQDASGTPDFKGRIGDITGTPRVRGGKPPSNEAVEAARTFFANVLVDASKKVFEASVRNQAVKKEMAGLDIDLVTDKERVLIEKTVRSALQIETAAGRKKFLSEFEHPVWSEEADRFTKAFVARAIAGAK